MKKQELRGKLGIMSGWAYAFGCAVGWGSFMMPGNIFLPEAGPVGSVIGIALAALAMFFICYSTAYMAKKYPSESGVHVYIGKILGADHGFLSAWAILLAYLSIIWANSTALIILIRSIWGDVLQFGFHYTIFDYDVYFGEVLVTVSVMVFFALLTIVGKRLVRISHVLLAILHIGLLIAIFVGVFALGRPSEFIPFAETNVSSGVEIFNIVMLAPWMFVGFEAFMYMFNSGGRESKHVNVITIIAVITVAIAYIIPVLIPVLALPDGYTTWTSYLEASKSSEGLMSLPVFYSTYYALGDTGLKILVASIFCAIATSLFGLYRASARLLVSMSEEELMPKVVGKTNKHGEPYIGILIVLGISIIVPFFGRTAIGWIVDITTITATIVYVYSTIGSLRLAIKDKDASVGIKISSVVGMGVAAISILFLLIPNVFSENKIATESYFILALWSLAGLIYYWFVYKNDKKDLYGKSTAMWIIMAFLIMFSSVMWIRQRSVEYISQLERWQKGSLSKFMSSNALIQIGVVIVVLIALYYLFSILLKRQKEADKKAMEFESKSDAKTAFLFNMSHDIRTPMNAILGFTDLALLDTSDSEKMNDYLHKIKDSGVHLLSLINDILEMSRIESGKIEMEPKPVDLEEVLSNIYSIMKGQAAAKGQSFKVDSSAIEHKYVSVDRLRLNQVLINLISNAIKYTPDDGSVSVKVNEESIEDNNVKFHFVVEDNGIGMSEEFASKIFEDFEREKREETSKIQGTGLGMAITKNIVDLMQGTIEVDTKENVGTKITVVISLPVASEEEVEKLSEHSSDITEADFAGKRVLLADDMEINREIGVAILESYGFDVVEAEDGQDALIKVVSRPAGYFDIVFMDIQMPRLNGYEAAMSIRNINDKNKANVPIIAMTANAFQSDVDDAKKAGMNGHVAKPIDQEQLVAEIKKVL